MARRTPAERNLKNDENILEAVQEEKAAIERGDLDPPLGGMADVDARMRAIAENIRLNRAEMGLE